MGWVSAGLRFVPFIVEAINAVERLFSSRKGKEKQDAAMELVESMVLIYELGAEADVFDNKKVQSAARHAIDAVVAFQNAVRDATNAKNK